MHLNAPSLKSTLLSFFSLNFYVEVLNGQKRFRVFLVTFLLSIVIAIQATIFLIKDVYPLTKDIESNATSFINEYYPAELEVKIKNGKASSNVTEPYYLTIPKEVLENPTSFGKKKYSSLSKVRLIAIDTKGKAEDFEAYQSIALLTEGSLVYYNDGNINIQSLRAVDDLTLNKNKIISEIKKYSSEYHIPTIINAVILLVPLFIVLASFVGLIFKFFLLSIAVWIIIKINLLNIPLKKAFLYTSAIAFIPTLLWNIVSAIPLFEVPVAYLGFVVDLIVLIIAYLGILKLKRNFVGVVEPVKAI